MQGEMDEEEIIMITITSLDLDSIQSLERGVRTRAPPPHPGADGHVTALGGKSLHQAIANVDTSSFQQI